jgi:hypothetical protein
MNHFLIAWFIPEIVIGAFHITHNPVLR